MPFNEQISLDDIDLDLFLFNDARVDMAHVMKLLSKGAALNYVISVVRADSKFMDCREQLTAYIKTLTEGATPSVSELEAGYVQFKADQQVQSLTHLADKHGVDLEALKAFAQNTLSQGAVDEDELSGLFSADLNWKERGAAETHLMRDLIATLPMPSSSRHYS